MIRIDKMYTYIVLSVIGIPKENEPGNILIMRILEIWAVMMTGYGSPADEFGELRRQSC